ncbi:MAG: DUF4238 domain-containing protein [Nitrospirae bacterium]|nr:DUF4238 domain-containing protein [Nitrospirota bacterium]
MPENKKHHYVPRFYLRNFSSDQDRNFIGLINLKHNLFVSPAAINGQCYRNYFYGHQAKIEKAIGDIERRTAFLFRSALDNDVTPERDSPEHCILIYYLAIQFGRTEVAEEKIKELGDKLFKYMLESERPDVGPLDKIKIGCRDAVLQSLTHAVLMSPILWDLDFKLIEAKNRGEFITSDNPVVIFNQYFENPMTHFTRGLASRGLQIYLPISPKRAFLFYDKMLYKVNQSKEPFVPVFPIDIRELNALQYLNAKENIYFSDPLMKPEIDEMIKAFSSRRVAKEFTLKKVVIVENGKSERESIALATTRRFNPALRFISVDRTNERVSPGVVRDPHWVKIVTDFADAVDRGDEKGNDFNNFVERHPLRYAPS